MKSQSKGPAHPGETSVFETLFVRRREAARLLAVCESTLDGWIGRGLIPATRPPGARSVLIKRADLLAFAGGVP
jgi:excisionase family DNA binding protein